MIVVAVYLCHFIWGKGTFRLKPFKPDMKMLGRITLIGIPEGITELCTGVTVFMFNHIIIAFLGEDHIIYYTVSAYVNTLVIMTMVAISQGLQPLVSFYLGRKEMDICKKLLRYGFIVSSVIAVTAFAGLNLLAKQVVAAFIADTNSEVFSTSVAVFRKFSISFLFIGINVVTAGFLTAMGQPKGAFIISVGRGLILPVTALILLAYATGGSGIWWAQLFSEVVCVVLSVILLKKERRNFGKLKLGSISPK